MSLDQVDLIIWFSSLQVHNLNFTSTLNSNGVIALTHLRCIQKRERIILLFKGKLYS